MILNLSEVHIYFVILVVIIIIIILLLGLFKPVKDILQTGKHTLPDYERNYEGSTESSCSRIYGPVEKKLEGTCWQDELWWGCRKDHKISTRRKE
jgi:hypothetical protein